MDEILRQVLAILRATWKHRRLGMLVAWIVGAIAAGVILRIPDRYEASARIFVDTHSILKPLMAGLAVQPNVDQQIMMLSRTLISRPNVEKVAWACLATALLAWPPFDVGLSLAHGVVTNAAFDLAPVALLVIPLIATAPAFLRRAPA